MGAYLAWLEGVWVTVCLMPYFASRSAIVAWFCKDNVDAVATAICMCICICICICVALIALITSPAALLHAVHSPTNPRLLTAWLVFLLVG